MSSNRQSPVNNHLHVNYQGRDILDLSSNLGTFTLCPSIMNHRTLNTVLRAMSNAAYSREFQRNLQEPWQNRRSSIDIQWHNFLRARRNMHSATTNSQIADTWRVLNWRGVVLQSPATWRAIQSSGPRRTQQSTYSFPQHHFRARQSPAAPLLFEPHEGIFRTPEFKCYCPNCGNIIIIPMQEPFFYIPEEDRNNYGLPPGFFWVGVNFNYDHQVPQ